MIVFLSLLMSAIMVPVSIVTSALTAAVTLDGVEAAAIKVHVQITKHLPMSQSVDVVTNSPSTRILYRAAPPRLQVDQNFLTQKIVADPKFFWDMEDQRGNFK